MANIQTVFAPKTVSSTTFKTVPVGKFFEFNKALYYKLNTVNALVVTDKGIDLRSVGNGLRQNVDGLLNDSSVIIADAGVGFTLQQEDDTAKAVAHSKLAAVATSQKRGAGGKFA